MCWIIIDKSFLTTCERDVNKFTYKNLISNFTSQKTRIVLIQKSVYKIESQINSI